jgi:hypothetical protein
METPHIEFTWSSDALATILDTLKVQGLGSTNKTTGLYSTWADQEQWALYTSKLMQWMPGLLNDEERKTLEKKLSAVESAFNTYLSQPGSNNKEQRITEFRELLKQLEEIEALICDCGSHAAYPYFARWFTLNVAVLKAFTNYENRLAQVKGVKVWWRGRNYLEQVFHSACSARASQVTTSVTGAFMDRVYVRDERTGTPLTIDVKMGTEDENAILNIHQLLRNKAGWQYIKDISLEESVKILEQVRNALTVTTESQTKQDKVLDASQFWRDKQKFIEYEIEEQRKACEPAFDRLINQEISKSRLPNEKVDGEGKLLIIGIEERAVLAKSVAGDVGLEIANELVPTLIGMIPVAGPLIASITKLFFGFLGRSQPDPWVEFEKKMERLIRLQITNTVAESIKNGLKSFDRELSWFFQEYHLYSNNMTPTKRQEFRTRASSLIGDISGYQFNVLTPASNAYYKVAPYYQHFFLTFMTALAIGEKMGLETIDFPGRRDALYRDTNTFIYQAFRQISEERKEDITYHHSHSCAGSTHLMYDTRLNRNLVVDITADSALAASKNAAGLIAGIQLLYELSEYVDGIIQKDGQTTVNKSMIRDTYDNCRKYYDSSLKNQLLSFKLTLSSLGSQQAYISQQVPTGTTNLSFNYRDYVHPDVLLLESANGEITYGNFQKPPQTVFQIPIPSPIVTYYYIVNKKSNKVLDVAGGSTENMANLQQYSKAEVDQQKWQVDDAKDGYCYLISKKSGKVVAVDVNGTNNNVLQYNKISTALDQKWKLENAGNGYFYVINKQSGQALDVENDQINVRQNPKNSTDSQKWKFEFV